MSEKKKSKTAGNDAEKKRASGDIASFIDMNEEADPLAGGGDKEIERLFDSEQPQPVCKCVIL
eukprot:CAMPEP_0184014572 /NCGR_PEP_ID=MMETSP0954-20121128/5752_1 /TAXON_ID=627963 /ORGANISM="Aplanochytrium sp, Strain PBS07" /LENGTH=62 /DNA_ID=CAMNT_0026295105 /DNA_START=347 /DNA_END=535 /DNA_ORIENTATION=-